MLRTLGNISFSLASRRMKFGSLALLNSSKFSQAASEIATATDVEPKWQLVAAAAITRTPIITPELKPIENEYKKLLLRKEAEESLKSNHEIRHEEDVLRAKLAAMAEQDSSSLDEVAVETATEFEDKSTKEFNDFQFGSRVTEADKMGDLTSLNRALDRSLVLTTKQKLGSQYHWVFPQTPWNPGETLRQSCERVIRDVCGSQVKVKVLGNSPCGFFKYKYPKEVRKNGFIGAKVFFFSGHVLAFDDSETLEKNESFADYLWLTHDDLKLKLGKSYYQAVSQFLISDL